jgi:hypothetical protein
MFLRIDFISIFDPCFTAYDKESSTYHSRPSGGGHCDASGVRMV